ncbi:hypothetical protein Msil_3464 [Methylocella silvestris BL2]|uniref:Uncharacterized protein n=1 Tax=Methylocella silvestris (strain DSM 15510 / CIP 108128 / LMG 27833 / NCIMB 13906 / BL2) TaxID=395965 RepID=B8ETK2_METSB|nr:hypothetical protein Msil_3464 [Methylocella silvestris BL2]
MKNAAKGGVKHALAGRNAVLNAWIDSRSGGGGCLAPS